MIRQVSIAIVSFLATGVTCLAQDGPLRKPTVLQASPVAGASRTACYATAASLVVSASRPPYGRHASRLQARPLCTRGLNLSAPSCAMAKAEFLTQ